MKYYYGSYILESITTINYILSADKFLKDKNRTTEKSPNKYIKKEQSHKYFYLGSKTERYRIKQYKVHLNILKVVPYLQDIHT